MVHAKKLDGASGAALHSQDISMHEPQGASGASGVALHSNCKGLDGREQDNNKQPAQAPRDPSIVCRPSCITMKWNFSSTTCNNDATFWKRPSSRQNIHGENRYTQLQLLSLSENPWDCALIDGNARFSTSVTLRVVFTVKMCNL